MIYWAQLLHIYQPPTQSHQVLAKISEECYRPLLHVLQDYPHAKITINICGVLSEMLAEHNQEDVLTTLANLGDSGQVEFTGSAKYHAILPLIPPDEMERQIWQNNSTNRRLLGNSFVPKGFFPPELCFSPDIVAPINQTGHRWLLLSGVSCPVAWPTNTIYETDFQGRRLAVLFRDDIISNKISFRSMSSSEFLKHLKGLAGQKDSYIITAMDGETFGHHHKNWEKDFLARVYQDLEPRELPEIKMVSISELVDIFPHGQTINPRLSSWSSSIGEIETGNPYPLWRDPNNLIHQLQWKYIGVCLELTRQAVMGADNTESKNHAATARDFMDRALHSDQFWWANSKPKWDINLIHKGLLFGDEAILNAYYAIASSSISQEKKREYYYRLAAARELKHRIIDQLLGIFQ